MLSDADGNTVMMIVPDDQDQPLGIGVIEGESFNIADPLFVLTLWPDQGIALGQALVRAGVRKEVIRDMKHDPSGRLREIRAAMVAAIGD